MPCSSRSVLRQLLAISLIAAASACDLDIDTCVMGDCATPGPDIPVESKPTRVAGGLTFTSISVGLDHACGIATGGRVYCWGARDASTSSFRVVASPEPVPGTDRFVSIAASHGATCGVAQDGRTLCWGSNNSGQLGNGGVGAHSSAPVPVEGGVAFRTVSMTGSQRFIGGGGNHGCGLTEAGAAWCWGGNGWGQLGNGTLTSASTPVAVSGGHVFESISVGAQFTCGIVAGGAAYCWGMALDGQLGDDPPIIRDCGTDGLPCSTTPVRVGGGFTFTAISSGAGFACGLEAEGLAYCWGSDTYAPLFDMSRWTHGPAPLSGSPRFTAISAGTSSTCALTSSGEAFCWGSNSFGQLGDGTRGTRPPTVTRVSTDLRFATIAVGGDTACALTPVGTAYCWGSDKYEQVGNGR